MISSDGVKTREPNATGVTLSFAVVAAVLVAAFMYGRGNAIRAEQNEAATIKLENEAFCGALNIKSDSPMFTECASGLTVIRSRQRQDWESQMAGVL